ncbi:MAG TPA: expansin EXLX1 family cellulose-binding protein [Trebonia sp.]|nr:expansin EXLX1 family cellulose-binding protein [Trebonia sp.]
MKAAPVLATAAVLAAAGLAIPLTMAARTHLEPRAAHAAVLRTSAVVSPAGGSPAVAGSPALAAGTVKATARSAATRPAATGATPTASGKAPLAGRIVPGVTYHGVATEYSAGDGNGACLFGPAANLMIAAMNYTDYETAKACGDYIRVKAANGASVTVLITNECPLPCAPGQLDLSQQAFAKLADPAAGRITVTWKLLSPAMSRKISIRYMTGSSQWWCGIQVIGHRNPVARLEVRVGNRWRRLPRTDYNYFISAHGSGCGGPIRITDIYGQRLTVNGVALLPNVKQPTRVQFARH